MNRRPGESRASCFIRKGDDFMEQTSINIRMDEDLKNSLKRFALMSE